jgi:hypothetical protein
LIIIARHEVADKVAKDILESYKGRDLGEASWVLGMSVKRDIDTNTTELSQERMIESALDRFEQKNSELSWVPLDSTDGPVPDPHERAREKKKKQLSQTDDIDEIEKLNKQLASYDKDVAPLSKQEHSNYMPIIGTVQNIAVVTRPDIAFAAASLARYELSHTSFDELCYSTTEVFISDSRSCAAIQLW